MDVISLLKKYKYIIIIVILIIYLISLYGNTEGFDDNFEKYQGPLVNSYLSDAIKTPNNHIYSFYKGGGDYTKSISKDNDSTKKLSLLNNLLDRFLSKIINYNQDCEGKFTKYSDCSKTCGDGIQTRKYVINKKAGKHGSSCKYDDGYTEETKCFNDSCDLGERCEINSDCSSKNCDPETNKCEEWVKCSKENLHICDEYNCKQLNNTFNSSYVMNGSYLWSNTDSACFFKTPAEMEIIIKDIYKYNFNNPSSTEYKGECDWFQKKGLDDQGKCKNRDNIIVLDDKPQCKSGWKPEPTRTNIEDACLYCNLGCIVGKSCVPRTNTYYMGGKYVANEKKKCQCQKNWHNVKGKCIESTATDQKCNKDNDVDDVDGTSDNWKIKIKPGGGDGCSFCKKNEQFIRDGGRSSCSTCPDGYITRRGLDCSGEGENCSTVVDFVVESDDLLSINDGGNAVSGNTALLDDNYMEECLNICSHIDIGAQGNWVQVQPQGGCTPAVTPQPCVEGSYMDMVDNTCKCINPHAQINTGVGAKNDGCIPCHKDYEEIEGRVNFIEADDETGVVGTWTTLSSGSPDHTVEEVYTCPSDQTPNFTYLSCQNEGDVETLKASWEFEPLSDYVDVKNVKTSDLCVIQDKLEEWIPPAESAPAPRDTCIANHSPQICDATKLLNECVGGGRDIYESLSCSDLADLYTHDGCATLIDDWGDKNKCTQGPATCAMSQTCSFQTHDGHDARITWGPKSSCSPSPPESCPKYGSTCIPPKIDLDRSTFSYDPKIYGDQGELGLSGYWQLNVKTVPDGQTATPSQWDDKDWTNKPMTVHRTATHPYRHIQQKSAVQAAVDFVGGGCG